MQTNPVFPSINEASELIVAPEDLLPVSCAFEVYIHVFYYYLVRQPLLYNNILDLSTFICSFIHAVYCNFFQKRLAINTQILHHGVKNSNISKIACEL